LRKGILVYNEDSLLSVYGREKEMENGQVIKKVDYKKELREFYNPPKKNGFVDIPEMNYLMIDGKGNPNTSPDFQAAIEALFSVSYTTKFLSKKSGLDYVVMPLEALWYMDNMSEFGNSSKDEWQWTAMIMQPAHVSEALIQEAIEIVRKKKDIASLDKIRFQPYHEGLSVQILYVGPFDDEHPTIVKLHQHAAENGYAVTGKHHEIYLSDFRRVEPNKLKTIIRQPIMKQ
jgi:hypothetical protein